VSLRLSRRRMAEHMADRLVAGDDSRSVLLELAAYLKDSRRIKEGVLIVRDIERALLSRGVVVAKVTSARPLKQGSLEDIKQFIASHYGVKTVYVRELIDASAIGGFKVSTPDKELDRTLSKYVSTIKASKV
jgi:F0F1-type ATP synthase delta subunit